MYLAKIKEIINSLDLKLEPFTLEEIEKLEHTTKKKLPEALKEYLLFCGNNFIDELVYISNDLDSYIELQTSTKTFLEEYNDSKYRPDNSFTFWFDDEGLGGFFFINLDEGEDPTVYWAYQDGLGDIISDIEQHDKFSEFLVKAINNQVW